MSEPGNEIRLIRGSVHFVMERGRETSWRRRESFLAVTTGTERRQGARRRSERGRVRTREYNFESSRVE
ncbi:hypothetical protein Mapa_004808 [Marchantia paleacea]|nr:hypothetical protein Mapa_004808 [Marchantia paleacea]